MTIPVTMRASNLFYCLVRHFPLRLIWCDLDLSTVPRGTFFAHPYGVTLNVTVKWGRGCVVRQNVTVGYRWRFDGSEPGAVIGDGVRLEAGCTILGPVHIGSGAVIGAGRSCSRTCRPDLSRSATRPGLYSQENDQFW